jgi:pyroglutamyl-peptidase
VPRILSAGQARDRMTFEHRSTLVKLLLLEMARLARHQAAAFLSANPSGSHTGS